MQQFILNIDDQQLETTLNEIAQKEGKNITDVIINILQYFIKQRKSSLPVKSQIDGKLRTKLDAILACGNETEYVRHNPILREKVERGIENYRQGNWFVPTQEQLDLDG